MLCFTSDKHYWGFNVEERCSCKEGFTTEKCVIYLTTVVPVTRVVSMKIFFLSRSVVPIKNVRSG